LIQFWIVSNTASEPSRMLKTSSLLGRNERQSEA
jgi:hypothetical protein